MNLLAVWQLPEWFSFSSFLTALITLIGLIAAIIKLKAAEKNNKISANTQIDLLSTMSEKLGSYTQVLAMLQTFLDKSEETAVKFNSALSDNEQSNANFANFILQCFSLSNLSEENKAKIQYLADQIFYKDNSKLTDTLRKGKEAAEKLLNEKTSELEALKNEIAQTKEKLEAVQSTIKKSRRIS